MQTRNYSTTYLLSKTNANRITINYAESLHDTISAFLLFQKSGNNIVHYNEYVRQSTCRIFSSHTRNNVASLILYVSKQVQSNAHNNGNKFKAKSAIRAYAYESVQYVKCCVELIHTFSYTRTMMLCFYIYAVFRSTTNIESFDE